MVVMEYVDGDTFVVAKQKISEESIERVRSAVRRALELLHHHGLVFGQNQHNSISHSQYLCRLVLAFSNLMLISIARHDGY